LQTPRNTCERFLADALEELGFVTSECAFARELAGVLDAQQPDLVVLGVSVNGTEIGEFSKFSSGKITTARFSSSANRTRLW